MLPYSGIVKKVHVFGHPNLPLNVDAAPANAQVLNCRNFCLLLARAGLPYIYYGISGSTLPGDVAEFADIGLPTGEWEYGNEWHCEYTRRLQGALDARSGKTGAPEVIAALHGGAHADVEPGELPVIEAMVGYDHCTDAYRVFPSYSHQASLYTSHEDLVEETKFFDTVIPHFLDPEDFWIAPEKGDYALYFGRNAPDKGIVLAESACKAAGIPLKKVFDGYFGVAKTKLISQAIAVFMPTLYLEPFGYVAIEAQLCGVPVLCTDWGAFPETVEQGVTGFRCRTEAEFLAGLRLAPTLDPGEIREAAIQRFGIESVTLQYLSYFNFVWKVHQGNGYYTPDATRWFPLTQ